VRIHLLALPNVQTTGAYFLDGFCMATIRFATMLKSLGYHVTLYASEENDAPCDELVTVITKEEQTTILNGLEYQHAALTNFAAPLWTLSNNRTIKEISKRKQARDFICIIGGTSQEPVARAHPDLMSVEYSIGYVSSFSQYRVYESHIWRSMTHGYEHQIDGRFFDDVIPLFFDPSEFTFREKKDDFVLYVGRLIPKKGLSIACQAATKAGLPLKVIGHGDTSLITDGAEYLGQLGVDERNEWMSKASALICPTLYIEPFGSVAVEAQMCGTPVISTDFGGFVETVEQRKTGFRCRYMGEFVQALRDVAGLPRLYIRERAVEKYAIENVKHDYQRYFERLMLLWEKGWDTCDVREKAEE